MLLKIYPQNPSNRQILKVVEILEKGGIIIYPTDTVYGIGCDIFDQKSVIRIAQIKGLNPAKSQFSFICHDLSQLSDYAAQVDNNTYKLMKQYLPGPFTFILQANHNVPKILKSPKKTVGIRVPDNDIIRQIVKELGHPILSTSVRDGEEIKEYTTDPELIYEKYKSMVDVVIDGGIGKLDASTVVDCTQDEPIIIRQGIGIIE